MILFADAHARLVSNAMLRSNFLGHSWGAWKWVNGGFIIPLVLGEISILLILASTLDATL
jgi:hypothetical protein